MPGRARPSLTPTPRLVPCRCAVDGDGAVTGAIHPGDCPPPNLKDSQPVAHHLRPARAASLALAVGASFLIPMIGSQVAQAATHVANPFVGSVPYLNPNYVAEVNAQATTDGGSLGSAEASVANYQTAIWMDHIGAITGDSTHLGLQAQLDNAETQSQSSSSPVLVEVVIYDLPGRPCRQRRDPGDQRRPDRVRVAVHRPDRGDRGQLEVQQPAARQLHRAR